MRTEVLITLAVFNERLRIAHTLLAQALNDASDYLPNDRRDLLRQAITCLSDAEWRAASKEHCVKEHTK